MEATSGMATRPSDGRTKMSGASTSRKSAGGADLLAPTHGTAFFVYIAGEGPDGDLSVGATGNLAAVAPLRLLWFERLDDIPAARALAERIEAWPRAWKTQMIARTNPEWQDLVG